MSIHKEYAVAVNFFFCCNMQKLQRIAASVPDLDRRDITQKENSGDLPFDTAPRLSSNSRVIDAGSGTGALIPFLQVCHRFPAAGVRGFVPAVSIAVILLLL